MSERLLQQTALVLGGSGFLGGYLIEELVKQGHRVIVGDLRAPTNLDVSADDYKFLECDIRDDSSIKKLEELRPTVVYHLAGLSDLDVATSKPLDTFQSNVLGTIRVLEACKKIPTLKRFVFASSAYAVSSKGSYYGISKWTCERFIEEFCRTNEIPFTIIRYGSLYGHRATSSNGIYRMLSQALKNKMIEHLGDGEEVREYIHARDAARMSISVLEEKYKNSHLIFTGVERLKQRDVLYMICEMLNDQVELKFNEKTRPSHYRVTPYSFSTTVAQKMISSPYIDFGQGLIECMEAIQTELRREQEK